MNEIDLYDGWMVNLDQRLIMSPDGKTYRISATRSESVAKIHGVIQRLRQAFPQVVAIAQNATLYVFVMECMKMAREDKHSSEGHLLARMVEIKLWGIEWIDVAAPAAEA